MSSFAGAVSAIDGIPKGHRTAPLNFAKTVQAVLKTKPDAALAKKESTELPQLLQDRNLKGNLNKANALIDTINAKTNEALKKAEEGDMKSAAPLLKDSAVALKTLKGFNDQYTKVTTDKKFKGVIDSSKDKSSILKSVKVLTDGFSDAERKVRGIMTTIKKAG